MTIEDFNNLVIKEEGDKVIRFRDIGIAEVDAEDTRSIMKRNGVPMVACAIIPQPGANYIDIVDRAYEVMADLQKDLPDDVEAGIAFDNTVFIRNSINEVKSTIVEAFVLVVLIIFLFLRSLCRAGSTETPLFEPISESAHKSTTKNHSAQTFRRFSLKKKINTSTINS